MNLISNQIFSDNVLPIKLHLVISFLNLHTFSFHLRKFLDVIILFLIKYASSFLNAVIINPFL